MKKAEQNRMLIVEAVKEVEKKTSGEVVPMLIKQSDSYPVAHFRFGVILSIVFPLALYFFTNIDELLIFIWAQIIGLVTGYVLTFIPLVKKFFCSKKELNEEVHQRLKEAFIENNLHTTRDRTGILIMVSLLEHRVEILADVGINEKVSEGAWDEIVANLVLEIKKGKLVNGYVAAIYSCGEILEKYFPIKDDDTNELSDNLIVE